MDQISCSQASPSHSQHTWDEQRQRALRGWTEQCEEDILHMWTVKVSLSALHRRSADTPMKYSCENIGDQKHRVGMEILLLGHWLLAYRQV